MKASLNRRLSLLTFMLVVVGILLMVRLASFQFNFDAASYLENAASNTYRQLRNLIPDRGRIYDRNGELLAGNTMEYGIGVSPDYITNKPQAAHDLALALGLDEATVLTKISKKAQYVLLARPVSAEVAQKVAKLDMLGVVPEPIPRRIYPQGSLAGQVVGFVGGDGDTRRGYVGIEG